MNGCNFTDKFHMEEGACRRYFSSSDEACPRIGVLSFDARRVIMRDGNVHKLQSIKLSLPFKNVNIDLLDERQ